MELKMLLAIVALLVGIGANALPAQKSSRQEANSDEVEYVPVDRRRPQFGNIPIYFNGDEKPVVDTGYFPESDFDGFGSSWGFTSSFDDLFKRMRNQLSSIFNSFPFRSGGNDTSIHGVFGGFGDVDLSKGNTTSETKIINGHKVVINETSYKSDDENGATVFKVRVVNIHPTDDDDGTERSTVKSTAQKTPSRPKEVEPLENSSENEIPKHKEVGIDDIESNPEKLTAA